MKTKKILWFWNIRFVAPSQTLKEIDWFEVLNNTFSLIFNKFIIFDNIITVSSVMYVCLYQNNIIIISLISLFHFRKKQLKRCRIILVKLLKYFQKTCCGSASSGRRPSVSTALSLWGTPWKTWKSGSSW